MAWEYIQGKDHMNLYLLYLFLTMGHFRPLFGCIIKTRIKFIKNFRKPENCLSQVCGLLRPFCPQQEGHVGGPEGLPRGQGQARGHRREET